MSPTSPSPLPEEHRSECSVPDVLSSTAGLSDAQVVAPKPLPLTAERRWHWGSPWQELKSSPRVPWPQEDLLRPAGTEEAQPLGSDVLAFRDQKQQPPGLTFPNL